MKRKASAEAVEALARQLWLDREKVFAWLMKSRHGVDEFHQMPWDEAPRSGRADFRQRARRQLKDSTQH